MLDLDKQVAAFCSGTVIVLNLWGIRHSGLLGDAAKEAVNLQKCINVLKECEKRSVRSSFFYSPLLPRDSSTKLFPLLVHWRFREEFF